MFQPRDASVIQKKRRFVFLAHTLKVGSDFVIQCAFGFDTAKLYVKVIESMTVPHVERLASAKLSECFLVPGLLLNPLVKKLSINQSFDVVPHQCVQNLGIKGVNLP